MKKYFEEKGLSFDQEKFSFKPTESMDNVKESDSEKNDENVSRESAVTRERSLE